MQLYNSFRLLIIILEPPIHFDIVLFLTLFEVIYLPLSIYCFLKRKKIGWIMLVAWISYRAMAYIISIIYNLSISPDDLAPVLADKFKPNYFGQILHLAFYVGSIIVLANQRIRALFSVSKANLFFAIAVGSLSILLVISSIFFINELY